MAINTQADQIKRLVAPVVAFLRHDIARPDTGVQLNKEWAEEQLSKVLALVNDKPVPVVDNDETENLQARELRELVQSNFTRRD